MLTSDQVKGLSDVELLAAFRRRDGDMRYWEMQHYKKPQGAIATNEVAINRAILAEIILRGLSSASDLGRFNNRFARSRQ